MSVEPDYAAEMRLADGVRCDDCAHAPRCFGFGFGFSKPGRTSCDFWPSRYRPSAADTSDRSAMPRDDG